MSEVIGRTNHLPGARHALPEGTMCDSHPHRPAVARIQGETDSFGAELNDLCAECARQEWSYRCSAEARTGKCDWCKSNATDLSFARDYDEGSGGPVYEVCGTCRERQAEALREEAERWERENPDYGDDWDDFNH